MNALPPRKPKKEKRESRWKSQKHCTWLRKSFGCSMCGSTAGIEVAHVRMGSGAGMGQKPNDYRAVPLCRDCHSEQHRTSEPDFWRRYEDKWGQSLDQLLNALCEASPCRREIKEHKEGQ